MIRKTQAQIDKLKRGYYCNQCKEIVHYGDHIVNCPKCGTKLKIVYKENK